MHVLAELDSVTNEGDRLRSLSQALQEAHVERTVGLVRGTAVRIEGPKPPALGIGKRLERFCIFDRGRRDREVDGVAGTRSGGEQKGEPQARPKAHADPASGAPLLHVD